ncbi:MAG: hypothetical protein ISP58_03330 [Flavobacteriales bacterium]|nr:hypothetical protein [Flavobacteriales bacterium]
MAFIETTMINNKILAFILCMVYNIDYCQTFNYESLFSKKYVGKDTIVIDTFSVNPRTFQILNNNKESVSLDYKLLPYKGLVVFLDIPYDTLIFNYHPLLIDFSKKYYKHPISLNRTIEQKQYHPSLNIINTVNSNNLFQGTKLNRTGSISRGLMVGNNQDFSLNSNLNLQLSGMISPTMKILASVTDDNIPIQPQGNTQQLQDFDKVFIEVSDQKWKLTAGDFWIKNKDSYFLKYHKRGQGIHLKNKIIGNNNIEIDVENSASISKGKFGRNVIQGIEGNQGPYRLYGNENESFIIILSGTENVYIDGVLLKRGQNNDYIIDYNTSEISFTANTLINKDKRIIIEFQYSDKNYARSLLQSSTTIKKNNSSFYIHGYGEQDSKNQPLQLDFDLLDRQTLENIGDNIDLAIGSGIDSVEFNQATNLYQKIDSLGYEVYQYSNNEQQAVYMLTFSNVGQGNGNYKIKENNALGKVFEWIAPDTISFGSIIKNGDYSPIKKLVTPKKRQIISVGGKTIWSGNSLSYELSTSNMDLNTFSAINNEDNIGFAGLVNFENKNTLKEKWELNQQYRIESISKDYRRIERFREVEFERNWNIQNLITTKDQLLSSAKINLKHLENGLFQYQLNSYFIKDEFNGYKNDFKIKWNKKVNLNFDGSLMNSDGQFNTSFLRHKTDLFIPIKGFKLGFKDINENNQFFIADTLNNNSYRFYDWKVYIENYDSTKNRIQFFYQERYDWFKDRSILKKATKAISPGLMVGISSRKNFNLNYSLAYRMLQSDSSLTNILPENSLASRLNYNLKLLKGGINTNSFLEIGSGLELQKEFIYIEVPAGQGVYTWNDYNDNGIKELNEFEIAAFSDQATYIRVFTPNNNYVKIYSFQYNQNLNIDFKRIIDGKTMVEKFLNKFYNQTAVNTHKKTNDLDLQTLLNPLVNADNPIIQQMSNSLRNSLFFNRSSSKYSVELVTQLFANKNLLINGTDFISTNKDQIKFRWNMNKSFMLNSQLTKEIKKNSSTYMTNRNYDIENMEINNRISFQPNTLFRIAINGRYSEKRNSIEYGNEKAFINDIGLELRRSKRDKGLLNGELHLVNINYNGESSSTIGFEMLEGLQLGKNITWKLGFQKNMSNNIQISINYNGRKSEENRAIHTGSMQMRAFF